MPKKFQWINMYKSYVWAGFYEKQFPDQIFRFGSQWTASPLLDVCARTFFLTSFTTSPTSNKCWGFPSCIVNSQVIWYIHRRYFYKNELYARHILALQLDGFPKQDFDQLCLEEKFMLTNFKNMKTLPFLFLGLKIIDWEKEKNAINKSIGIVTYFCLKILFLLALE